MLGKECFKAKPSSTSVTQVCESVEDEIESGQRLRIVDTPGIFDSNKKNMLPEVRNFFKFLKPGPDALLVVLMPNRFREEDENVLIELRNFFGNDFFLEFTILIMNRKSEIINSSIKDIHQYVAECATDQVKKLYEQCGKRIVAVENFDTWEKRKLDAEEILMEIKKLDGIFTHPCFSMVHENLELKAENEKSREKIEELEKKLKDRNDHCYIN